MIPLKCHHFTALVLILNPLCRYHLQSEFAHTELVLIQSLLKWGWIQIYGLHGASCFPQRVQVAANGLWRSSMQIGEFTLTRLIKWKLFSSYQCFLWACISSLKTQVYLCHNIELFLDSEVRLRREFPNNHSVSSLALQDRNTMQRSCAIKPTSDTRETPPTAPACCTLDGRQATKPKSSLTYACYNN